MVGIPRTRKFCTFLAAALAATASLSAAFAGTPGGTRFIQVAASSKQERSAIADAGMSIEATRSDSVWGFADPQAIRELEDRGFRILGNFDRSIGRGGHETSFDFPADDARFHDYAELKAELEALHKRNPDITRLHSIGRSIEGRDLWAIPSTRARGTSRPARARSRAPSSWAPTTRAST